MKEKQTFSNTYVIVLNSIYNFVARASCRRLPRTGTSKQGLLRRVSEAEGRLLAGIHYELLGNSSRNEKR